MLSDDTASFTPQRSLVDEAMRTLTARIVHGHYPPGVRLVEERISREFGISRPPLRECFQALAREGLVTIVRNRGATVRVIERSEVPNIYACRAVLEELAASEAAEAMTDEDLGTLEKILDEMRAAAKDGDVMRYHSRNVDFHDAMCECAGNPVLTNLLRRLGLQVLRLRYISLSQPGRMGRSLESHTELMQALRKRDAARAGSISKEIILSAQDALISALDEASEDDGQ